MSLHPKTITTEFPIYDLEFFGIFINKRLAEWKDALDHLTKNPVDDPDEDDKKFLLRCQAMVEYYQKLYASLSTHLDLDSGDLLYEFLDDF